MAGKVVGRTLLRQEHLSFMLQDDLFIRRMVARSPSRVTAAHPGLPVRMRMD